MDAKSADWAHKLVQRHACAARALEHMYNEKNVKRLIEVGAELEAALTALPSDAAQAPLTYEQIDEVWKHANGTHLDRNEFGDMVVDFARALLAAPVAPQAAGDAAHAAKTETPKVTDEMVSRFLGWHLPDDFAPDCGVSFKPLGHPNGWPVGTNLFTATQARAMLEHVLAVQDVASSDGSAGICFFCGEPMTGKHEDDCPQASQPNERAAFEAKFPISGGVDWDGAKYVVRDGYENSYPVERFSGQWEAWQARATAPQATAQLDKRNAFEAWARPHSYDLTRCSPVGYASYKSDVTNGALAGWLGAHEQPPLSTETVDKPVQSINSHPDARDAARYRWLREHRLFPSTSTFINPVELDNAIDADRKRSQR